MTARSVPEWVGKTPDEKPPARVVLRLFRRQFGLCALTGKKITPGDKYETDHIDAIINGGKNREKNLQIILVGIHKVKSALDVAEKAAVDSLTKAHIGIGKAKSTIPSRRGQPQAPKDKLPIPARPPRERFFVKETT